METGVKGMVWASLIRLFLSIAVNTQIQQSKLCADLKLFLSAVQKQRRFQDLAHQKY